MAIIQTSLIITMITDEGTEKSDNLFSHQTLPRNFIFKIEIEHNFGF